MAEIRGMQIPFRIDPETGGVAQVAGAAKVRQNVRMILATRIGERVMLRGFGTRVHSLAQEPNDEVLETALLRQVREALTVWEPRVLITRAQVRRDGGEAVLVLDYTLTTESVTDTLLVPLG
jgi:phage baseplate assembly protein W